MRSWSLMAVLMVSPALAQDAPLLSGPTVGDEEKQVGIGERRYSGEMMQPEARAEIAALDLLDLDPATRERVDALLAERAALVDKFVLGHVEQLASLRAESAGGAAGGEGPAGGYREGAAGGEGRAQARALFQGFMKALEPVSANGTLAEQLRAMLPAEQGERFAALLAEHEAQVLAAARDKAEAEGQPFNERQHRMRRGFEVLRQELRASADRTIVAAARDFEAFMQRASLSAEGDAVVRRHVTELVEKTRLRPQPEASMAALRQVFAELQPEDRQRLIEALREQRPGRM